MARTPSSCIPASYDAADAAAVQAIMIGEANKEQQIRAMKWIIECASGLYDLSYRPGVEGQRDTDFAEGRRFVGSQVVKLSRLNVSSLRRSEQ